MRRRRPHPLALTEGCRDRSWIFRFLAGKGAAPVPGTAAHIAACPACRKTVADLVAALVRGDEGPLPDPRTIAWARSLAGLPPAPAAAAPRADERPTARLAVRHGRGGPGPAFEAEAGAAVETAAARRPDGEARARVALGPFRLEVLVGGAGRRWTIRGRLAEGPADSVLVLADDRGERLGPKGGRGEAVGWPGLAPGRYRLSALSRDGAADVEIEIP